MTLDLVVTNGNVLMDGEFQPLDIAVQDGLVAASGARGLFEGQSASEIDAAGLLVLPGIIDSHFHSRAPSRPDRETFASATRAAAFGGVTAIVEMPISEPPAVNGEVIRSRAALAESEAYVDVGFYASSATLKREDLESSIAAGALAFKAFLQREISDREPMPISCCTTPTIAEPSITRPFTARQRILAEYGTVSRVEESQPRPSFAVRRS